MRDERGKGRRERGEEDMMREKGWYETIKTKRKRLSRKTAHGCRGGYYLRQSVTHFFS